MARFLTTFLILLSFSVTAQAKPAKGGKSDTGGGHQAHPRTLIFKAGSTKSRARVVFAQDVNKDVAIKVPLLTLEKKSVATDEENTEAESVSIKESAIKIAPAKAAESP